MSSLITVLALGDIIGSPGRKALKQWLPEIKRTWQPDIILANGENVADGIGITENMFKELTCNLGIHVIPTGNHWNGKKNPELFDGRYPNLLVPANIHNGYGIDRGYCIKRTSGGVVFAVINVIGKVYMHSEYGCPFQALEQIFKKIPQSVNIILVDIHGEASSEKQAIGHFLSHRASLCYGTHTHCPTADERIWNGRMGYITDVGMTGSYDSVIGMQKEASLMGFLSGEKKTYTPAKGDPWLCGVIAKIEPKTGVCQFIERVCHRSMVA